MYCSVYVLCLYTTSHPIPFFQYGCLEVLIEEDEVDKMAVTEVACKKATWPVDVAIDIFSFARLCLNPTAKKRPGMSEASW